MVLGEAAVPSIYWEPREPRLKRQDLPGELKGRRGNCRGDPLQPRTCLEREER